MLSKARGKGFPWPAPAFFKSRLLMCCTLSLIAGIALARRVPYQDWMPALIAALLLSAALAQRRLRTLSATALLLSFLLLGTMRGATEWQAPAMPPVGKWQVEGTVQGQVIQNETGVRFYLTDVRVEPEVGDPVTIDSVVYVNYQTTAKTKLFHGQRVRVTGTSYDPIDKRNPGGFDQRMWLAASGAHVRMYARSAPVILSQGNTSLMGLSISLSKRLAERIDAVFGKASSVIRAMLLGDQTEVVDEWYDWIRISGVAHILSVSGLHVGLWFMLLDRPLRRLPVSPVLRFLLAALLLASYAMLTGLKTSVLRASIMLLVMQGGRIVKRKPDPLTSVSIAAMVILLLHPLDLFSAGFQLSFGAVLGLILLTPMFSKILQIKPAVAADTMKVTLSAQLGALPPMAYWFGTQSLLSVPANMLIVPLSGFLIPVSALALLLNAIWSPLGWFFVEASKGIVASILVICRAVADVGGAMIRIPPFAWWTLVAFCFCVLLCSTAVVWRVRSRIIAAALAIGMAFAVGFYHQKDKVLYVQLDVGQALSGVLHVDGKLFVYDCGGNNSDLTEYVQSTGKDVEAVFLSHPHEDHIGGLAELLDSSISVKTIYVPANADVFGADSGYLQLLENASDKGVRIETVAAGDVLDLNGLAADVIAPSRDVIRGNDPNDRSIVLLVRIGEQTLMLCGDADGNAEPLGVDCDVLQVAHHGSKNAARQRFLDDATPDIALVSVGKNTYGHPDPKTMERLETIGADLYQTILSGAITVFFERDSVRVEVFCP